MALDLDNDGRLAKVTGVYIDQTTPVRLLLSTQTKWVGPNLVSWNGAGSSATLMAFFDHTKSGLTGDIPIGAKTGYVQIGYYTMNGVHISEISYRMHPPGPHFEHKIWSTKYPYFIDTPYENDEGDFKPEHPFFAYWKLTNGPPDYDTKLLAKYPQDFGSLMVTPPQNSGDYIGLYMKATPELPLERIPSSASIDDYFVQLLADPEQLVQTGKIPKQAFTVADLAIPGKFQDIIKFMINYDPDNIPRQRGGLYAWWNPQLSRRIFSSFRIYQNKNYLYFTYSTKSVFEDRQQGVSDGVRVLVYPDKEDPEQLAYALLDNDVLEAFAEEMQVNGPPNLEAYKKMLVENEKKWFFWFNNTLTPACNYITVPVAIVSTDDEIQMKMLEGFEWSVSRNFTSNGGDDAVVTVKDTILKHIHPAKSFDQLFINDKLEIFMDVMRSYYAETHPDKNFSFYLPGV